MGNDICKITKDIENETTAEKMTNDIENERTTLTTTNDVKNRTTIWILK